MLPAPGHGDANTPGSVNINLKDFSGAYDRRLAELSPELSAFGELGLKLDMLEMKVC